MGGNILHWQSELCLCCPCWEVDFIKFNNNHGEGIWKSRCHYFWKKKRLKLSTTPYYYSGSLWCFHAPWHVPLIGSLLMKVQHSCIESWHFQLTDLFRTSDTSIMIILLHCLDIIPHTSQHIKYMVFENYSKFPISKLAKWENWVQTFIRSVIVQVSIWMPFHFSGKKCCSMEF